MALKLMTLDNVTRSIIIYSILWYFLYVPFFLRQRRLTYNVIRFMREVKGSYSFSVTRCNKCEVERIRCFLEFYFMSQIFDNKFNLVSGDMRVRMKMFRFQRKTLKCKSGT